MTMAFADRPPGPDGYVRTDEGYVNNCAVRNGDLASNCLACSGSCPDAERMMSALGGKPVTRASSLPDVDPVTAWAHSSESVEHLTPYDVIGATTATMGAIDLDPASCERANDYIEAARYFSKEDDGLGRPWSGRVFLNPPGGLCDETGRPVYPRTRKREGCKTSGACGLPPGHEHKGVTSAAKHWWVKLAKEWARGEVTEAVFLGFSLEQLCSTQLEIPPGLVRPVDCVLCLPRRRIAYLHDDGAGTLVVGQGPPHASFLAYLGSNPEAFQRAFAPFGAVLIGHHEPESTFADLAGKALMAQDHGAA